MSPKTGKEVGWMERMSTIVSGRVRFPWGCGGCGRMGYFTCFDVHYEDEGGRVCAVVFEPGPSERVAAEYCQAIPGAAPYIAGQFYKRELPWLLAIRGRITEPIALIFVDGYVRLGEGQKGLVLHLYERLGATTPVIGVAKSAFRGAGDYTRVYRGGSRRPLYVSSVGIHLTPAARIVQRLGGEHRIPDVLQRVDALTKGRA